MLKAGGKKKIVFLYDVSRIVHVFLLVFDFLICFILHSAVKWGLYRVIPTKHRCRLREVSRPDSILIKTRSLVLSSASQMTSDQRISLVINIQLWVVFLLPVSSRFQPLVAILVVLLIGLSCFLTSLSWVFSRFSLTRRSSDCSSTVNLSGLTSIQLNFPASPS